jgi:predicted TIM-barrel enzyme
MLRAARDLDLLTVGYAFNAEDVVRLMEDAAPDIFIFHAGISAGGATGDAGATSLAETAARSEIHFQLARKIRPEVILLGHGAAIVDPEHAQYMVEHTGCHGVQLGSSIERLAVEGPIEARAAAFKATRLPGGRSHRP